MQENNRLSGRKGREFLYLSQGDVRELGVPMAEIVSALGLVLRSLPSNQPPRSASPTAAAYGTSPHATASAIAG